MRPKSRTRTVSGAISRLSDAKLAVAGASSVDPATGATAVMPALRSAGISVLQRDRLGWLNRRNARANANATAHANGAPTAGTATDPLTAEDLVLGYRIDVKTYGGDWSSVVRRKATYRINGYPIRGGQVREEGHVKPAAGVLGAGLYLLAISVAGLTRST